ncbi:MAG: NAD-binding protein, partial [Myxococcota bacterium]
MHAWLQSRLAGAFFSFVSVVLMGTMGYWWLGGGRWSLEDCLYMTIITLTTVGYGEVLPGFNQIQHVRVFTLLLIIMGMGVFVYFASTLTAYIIEGDLRRALKKTRMRKKLSNMRDHVIVCGAGSTGQHVIAELIATQTPFVVIDIDQTRLENLPHKLAQDYPGLSVKKDGFLYLVGDATEDDVLNEAGLDRARGLVAALS